MTDMSHDHQHSFFFLEMFIIFHLFSNPFSHFSYRDQFSQSSQFQMDKILAFFLIEYPLNIQFLSMSLHALVSEISFFMSLPLYGQIQDIFPLNPPAFQGLMMPNQYRLKSNCVHLLLLYRLGTTPVMQ